MDRGLQVGAVLLFVAVSAMAQRPVINEGGVVNAASYAGSDQPASAITRGGIASIFGRNLASESRQAETLPLPLSLAGTTVTVEGIAAPLFYVSPGQINFQVPGGLENLDTAFSRPLHVVVTTGAGASDPVPVDGARDAPGIFTLDARGCGHGAVLNVLPDGSRTVNGPDQSAVPGGFVSIFATGLGPVVFPPVDGEPASIYPLSHTQSSAGVYLGPSGFERHASPVTYSGRAPGLVGVDQVDVRLPEDAPEGCAIPLTLRAWTRQSQPVTISIRTGGGQCQTAPPARFGFLRWQRISTTGPQPSGAAVQETFTASFAEAAANQVMPPAGPPEPGCRCNVAVPKPGPRCLGTGPRTLGVGAITLEGIPSAPITVRPSTATGEVVYAAALPEGSVEERMVRVLAAGGLELGKFQAELPIPAPIQITSSLAPGTVIPRNQPFRVTWAGGRPDALVRVRLESHPAPIVESNCECTATASSGAVSFDLDHLGMLPVIPSDDVRVTITVSPGAGHAQGFSAPGLTREGTHEWSYEHRFMGLSIRSQ